MISMFMIMSAIGMKAQFFYGMNPGLAMITMQAMSQVQQSNPWSNVNWDIPSTSASIPSSWGNGYAGPMVSTDPCVNAAILAAQSDQRLMQQGVNVNYNSSSNRSSSHSHQCRVCNGTGQEIKDTWNGSSTNVYCSICRRSFNYLHSHVRCTTCGGSGYIND